MKPVALFERPTVSKVWNVRWMKKKLRMPEIPAMTEWLFQVPVVESATRLGTILRQYVEMQRLFANTARG
jgi:hypothetical protein